MSARRTVLAVAAFAAFSAIALFACTERKVTPAPTPAATTSEPTPTPAPPSMEDAVIRAAARATSAVVSIQSTLLMTADEASIWMDPENPGDRRIESIGSGLVYRPDGVIVTNDHVVRGAKKILVTLSSGKVVEATIIGSDPLTDVAVLRVPATGLAVLPLETQSMPIIGQWVIAVGSPFGLTGSVTVGVVSGIGRKDMGLQRFEQFIQTDAAINEGNSGGPLLDLSGRVIGINTAIVAGGMGVSFAIPAFMVKEIADTLLSEGRIARGYLGVQIQDLDANLRRYYRVPADETGVLVTESIEGGPAREAGVHEGDVILLFDDARMESPTALQVVAARSEPGSEHTITVWRQGKRIVLPVAVAPLPEETEDDAAPGDAPRADRLGITVSSAMTEGPEGGYLPGVMISTINIGSAAETAGLEVGDIVLEVDARPTLDEQEYSQAVRALPRGALTLFTIDRRGARLHRAVEVP
ncbi:trypsin-like peptidase domain-containing protein [bacterium]|nr:trypsin-like peptidase domain-containing protein [bacterium]